MEFRRICASQGWLLAKLDSFNPTVLLVGAGLEQKLRLRREGSIYQFASSPSGKCLAFSIDPQMTSWADMARDTVFTVGPDAALRPTKGHFATIQGPSVSPDCKTLTIEGVYQEVDPVEEKIVREQTGLFLAEVGSARESVRLAVEAPKSHNYFGVSNAAFDVTWSPSGDMIAYSLDGSTYTYSIANGITKFLIAGSRPAWSPDGNWLGYQGPDDTPMLFDLNTRKTEPLIAGIKCLWSIKWTPDSAYAIFAQYDRAGTVFQICRLRDRATAAIYHSGAPYSEARFVWVTRSTLAPMLAPGELVRSDP
jgi:WD40 repeat protein